MSDNIIDDLLAEIARLREERDRLINEVAVVLEENQRLRESETTWANVASERAVEMDLLNAELTRLREEKRRWIVDGGHDASCIQVKAEALQEVARLREIERLAQAVVDRPGHREYEELRNALKETT